MEPKVKGKISELTVEKLTEKGESRYELVFSMSLTVTNNIDRPISVWGVQVLHVEDSEIFSEASLFSTGVEIPPKESKSADLSVTLQTKSLSSNQVELLETRNPHRITEQGKIMLDVLCFDNKGNAIDSMCIVEM